MKTRVIKLGGSLLEHPEIAARTHQWLASNPASTNLFVVGGGEIVEAIRRLDCTHAFDQSFTHWLCVDLMDTTARIAARLFPEFELLVTPSQLSRFSTTVPENPRSAIVFVSAFYRRDQAIPHIPESWQTTSDSLAALLAIDAHADELVLFKSATPARASDSYDDWARMGLIDSAFPALAAKIPNVRLVNLRQ